MKIIVLAIGVLLAIAGIVFLAKEKDDPESKKIYLITTVIGVVLAAISAALLFL